MAWLDAHRGHGDAMLVEVLQALDAVVAHHQGERKRVEA
jgi:hypothetical protein